MGFEGEKVGLIPALGFQRCGIAELHHVLALLLLHSTRASGERQGELLMSGLPGFRASLFGRQSLGLFLIYRSCIDQALAILGGASFPQPMGEQAALLSAVSNAFLVRDAMCACVPVHSPGSQGVQSTAGASKPWAQRGFPTKSSSQ